MGRDQPARGETPWTTPTSHSIDRRRIQAEHPCGRFSRQKIRKARRRWSEHDLESPAETRQYSRRRAKRTKPRPDAAEASYANIQLYSEPRDFLVQHHAGWRTRRPQAGRPRTMERGLSEGSPRPRPTEPRPGFG